MPLTTGPQPAGLRSTDVVPMLAGNYFPPSGEVPNLLARASSLMIPLLILLVTCTNVSALLAGLAIARRREIAVRLSLGAARRRIVRQLVTESVLLAVAAGALALLVIWILLRFVESSIADAVMAVDWRAILFTLVVAGLAGVVFGLSPALHGTRVSLEVLKDSVGGVVVPRSRLQSGLVVAQIALTQPLLLGMGALILEMREDLGKSRRRSTRIACSMCGSTPIRGMARSTRHAKTRSSACSPDSPRCGVVAVVPQENADDYFEAVVHRADQIGEEPERPIAVRAQAAPAGYFPSWACPWFEGAISTPRSARIGRRW